MKPSPIRNEAEALADLIPTLDRDELITTIIATIRGHYIKGGIAAIDSLTEALPAEQLMEAPPDARKVISALLNVCEKFRATMVSKL